MSAHLLWLRTRTAAPAVAVITETNPPLRSRREIAMLRSVSQQQTITDRKIPLASSIAFSTNLSLKKNVKVHGVLIQLNCEFMLLLNGHMCKRG